MRAYGNEAKLEKKKDRYQVEMKHIDVTYNQAKKKGTFTELLFFLFQSQNMIYDAEVSTEEEFNCILIYNEEKKVINITITATKKI